MQSELFQNLEKMAAKGIEAPKTLEPPEMMLYYMLMGLYSTYQSGKLTKEQGQERKRQIYNTFEKVEADYKQYIQITKEYQKRLREGYNIGGVEVMKGDNHETN